MKDDAIVRDDQREAPRAELAQPRRQGPRIQARAKIIYDGQGRRFQPNGIISLRMANLGYIQVIRQCNQTCRFCSNPENRRELSLAQAKRLVDLYRRRGL